MQFTSGSKSQWRENVTRRENGTKREQKDRISEKMTQEEENLHTCTLTIKDKKSRRVLGLCCTQDIA